MEKIQTKFIDIHENEEFVEICINDGVAGLKQMSIIKIFNEKIEIKYYLIGETYFRSNGDLDAKLKTEEFIISRNDIQKIDISKDIFNKLNISLYCTNEQVNLVSIPFDDKISFVFNLLLNFK